MTKLAINANIMRRRDISYDINDDLNYVFEIICYITKVYNRGMEYPSPNFLSHCEKNYVGNISKFVSNFQREALFLIWEIKEVVVSH